MGRVGAKEVASTSNTENYQGFNLILNPPGPDEKYVYEIDCKRVGDQKINHFWLIFYTLNSNHHQQQITVLKITKY